MSFMFEKLDVYQKAVDFAADIAALVNSFPRGYGYLVDQLNRASLSIAANIAEGNGRFTKPDRRNFFGIAPGGSTAATHPAVRRPSTVNRLPATRLRCRQLP